MDTIDRPSARQDRLVVQELSDEVLVYDLDRHRAHCLNRAASLPQWRRRPVSPSCASIVAAAALAPCRLRATALTTTNASAASKATQHSAPRTAAKRASHYLPARAFSSAITSAGQHQNAHRS